MHHRSQRGDRRGSGGGRSLGRDRSAEPRLHAGVSRRRRRSVRHSRAGGTSTRHEAGARRHDVVRRQRCHRLVGAHDLLRTLGRRAPGRIHLVPAPRSHGGARRRRHRRRRARCGMVDELLAGPRAAHRRRRVAAGRNTSRVAGDRDQQHHRPGRPGPDPRFDVERGSIAHRGGDRADRGGRSLRDLRRDGQAARRLVADRRPRGLRRIDGLPRRVRRAGLELGRMARRARRGTVLRCHQRRRDESGTSGASAAPRRRFGAHARPRGPSHP